MGYDAWLEKPYQDAARESEKWERLHENLQPPHEPGDDCPKCNTPSILTVTPNPDCFGCGTEQEAPGCPLHFPEAGTLWCEGCGEYVMRDEAPSYEPDYDDFCPPEPEYEHPDGRDVW
jgi:hypothetical protein